MGKQLGRKNNKRKLKWILAGIVIALLLAGGGIYAGFMVTDITYTGNKHYTQQQMTECIFGTEHPTYATLAIYPLSSRNASARKRIKIFRLYRNMMWK
jgi:flagellar basal body-associated protein FliL